ncbi:hypothetical protein [Microcoleus vaginatus]|uniref:hypothetical protein n=1 Tax=Microcoleus vaginatus TaxID=119532 RepID=UPI0032A8C8AA
MLLQRAVELLSPEYPELDVEKIKKSLTVTQVAAGKGSDETKIFEATYTANDPTQTKKFYK